jgi:hypothetical protein
MKITTLLIILLSLFFASPAQDRKTNSIMGRWEITEIRTGNYDNINVESIDSFTIDIKRIMLKDFKTHPEFADSVINIDSLLNAMIGQMLPLYREMHDTYFEFCSDSTLLTNLKPEPGKKKLPTIKFTFDAATSLLKIKGRKQPAHITFLNKDLFEFFLPGEVFIMTLKRESYD